MARIGGICLPGCNWPGFDRVVGLSAVESGVMDAGWSSVRLGWGALAGGGRPLDRKVEWDAEVGAVVVQEYGGFCGMGAVQA
ncbi:hypothetical protein GCM10022235_12790 [Kribbella ginsengisoli]|uniref:Uncharacterized protein n=1 Tax=Kribbella ginsengisoli TaxID=363865 RepID=A0ABP6W683_9ACTN